MSYHIDILEPDADANVALERMGKAIGALYAKSWETAKAKHSPGKQFDLNIQALANGWLSKQLKIFVAVDDNTQECIGFLSAVPYRALYYNSQIFHVQDWYTGGDRDMEAALFEYALKAARIIGCDEVFIQDEADIAPQVLGGSWENTGAYKTLRFARKS